MTCKGCASPGRGIVIATCRQCQLRDIALGPWFHKSMRAGRLMAEYIAQLRPLGDDIKAAHEQVKAAAVAAQTGVPA